MANEIYTPVPRKIGDLLTQVKSGQISLPVGYIMLWSALDTYNEKTKDIGEDAKQFPKPKDILIDGQQRLTAL